MIWQDRKGNERSFAEQKQANTAFPEKVNQIYTKVLHRTDPLYKDSNDAAICNEMLYAYQNGKIQEHPSGGYTAILETTEVLAEDGTKTRTVKRLNYEKFFDAVETANHDKWDDAAPTYTSYRPIGNKINRSDATVWNSAVSDRVRQFAITWYLDDEIAKLVETAEYAETAEHAETAESVGNCRACRNTGTCRKNGIPCHPWQHSIFGRESGPGLAQGHRKSTELFKTVF